MLDGHVVGASGERVNHSSGSSSPRKKRGEDRGRLKNCFEEGREVRAPIGERACVVTRDGVESSAEVELRHDRARSRSRTCSREAVNANGKTLERGGMFNSHQNETSQKARTYPSRTPFVVTMIRL
jgi:hypothetical protein